MKIKDVIPLSFLLLSIWGSGQTSDNIPLVERQDEESSTTLTTRYDWKNLHNAILDDSDILWAASLYYHFDLDNFGEAYRPYNSPDQALSNLPVAQVALLKYDRQACDYTYNSYAVHPVIAEDVLNLAWRRLGYAYKDPALSLAFTKEETEALLSKADTVTSLDPDTYEIVRSLARTSLESTSIATYKIHQLFYYRQSTHTFHTQLLAIAPLISVKNTESGAEEYKELFWFDPGRFAEEELDLNHPNSNIVELIELEIPFREMLVLKSPGKKKNGGKQYLDSQGLYWLPKEINAAQLNAYTPDNPDRPLSRKNLRKLKKEWRKLSRGRIPAAQRLRLFQYLHYNATEALLGVKWINLSPLIIYSDEYLKENNLSEEERRKIYFSLPTQKRGRGEK